MEAQHDLFLNQKGIKTRRIFDNILLKDIWALQKEEGDEEGANKTLRTYNHLKKSYEGTLERN